MGTEMISGSRIILESLSLLGIKDIFGYPGGAVLPIYDEIYRYDKINHYLSRHEQGSAHEADGYARASGRIGVCIATSGPGATNLVTGIMTAHMDSVPMIAITGQISRPLLGKDTFQESDIFGITLPITKMNYMVTNIRELPQIIKEAYHIATTGRPGPVLIDISRDIQLDEISRQEYEELFNKNLDLPGYSPTIQGHPVQIRNAIELINRAKKPLIIAGAGIIKSGATEDIREFIDKTQIPVAMTLLGLGAYPTDGELSLGMLGMHGVVPANFATSEADLIIAAGMRFDDRVTGDTTKFCPNAKVIHIDIDPAEIDKNIKADIPIVGDLKHILEELNEGDYDLDHSEWLDQISKWKEEYPKTFERGDTGLLKPQEVLDEVNNILTGDTVITTDVGQHQMWAAQYIDFREPGTLITSGGAGTMGFGLPAAIGAQIAEPDKKVLAILGDGGFQMTFHELMLIREHNLPVKILIINNSLLGMVRQLQEVYTDKRYSQVDLSMNPHFDKIGEAYEIETVTIKNREELDQNLRKLLESDEPVIINCIVDRDALVYPMVKAGKSPKDMIGKRGVIDGN